LDRPPHRTRGAVPLRLAAAAVLAWLTVAFTATLVGFGHQVAAPPHPASVALWRLGTPPAEAMGTVLADLAPHLAANQVVVFTSGSGVPSREFFLARWAAYFLPRQRVIGLSNPRAAAHGDVLLAYGPRPAPPRVGGRWVGAELARNYGARLFRLAPPGDGEP
jgi:hypothetical protein